MAEEVARRALGRGLAALIGDVESESALVDRARTSRRVPIEFLTPNPRNPRRSFGDEELAELAESVRARGVVQPILVRPQPGRPERFEIIAGERRWRAAQRAGLHDVPVMIHQVTDKEALELAIVENVQRADLNPLEEANGYNQLIEEFGYSQTELADVIGKSRPHVANSLRLLRLPEPVQACLRAGEITAGHARALVNAEDPAGLAKRIIDAGLTVRDAEALGSTAKRPRKDKAAKDPDTLALEKALADAVGMKVTLDHRLDGGGELRIQYGSLEQLDELCRRLQLSS